jgi:hypothetical protein
VELRERRALARLALVTGVLGGLLVDGGPGAPPAGGAPVTAAVVEGVDQDVQDQDVQDPAVQDPATPVPIALPVVVESGDGVLRVVAAPPAPVEGAAVRYLVEVEGGLGISAEQFATAAQATLADPRSWSAGGRPALHRVDDGPVDFRLVLASPALTDELCAPLRTAGRFSCFQDGRAVVNARRWLTGAPAYADRLEDYRHYVVNHEVGHALGRGHAGCPRAGAPAPVMMQQTKGVGACTPSAWPFP